MYFCVKVVSCPSLCWFISVDMDLYSLKIYEQIRTLTKGWLSLLS